MLWRPLLAVHLEGKWPTKSHVLVLTLGFVCVCVCVTDSEDGKEEGGDEGDEQGTESQEEDEVEDDKAMDEEAGMEEEGPCKEAEEEGEEEEEELRHKLPHRSELVDSKEDFSKEGEEEASSKEGGEREERRDEVNGTDGASGEEEDTSGNRDLDAAEPASSAVSVIVPIQIHFLHQHWSQSTLSCQRAGSHTAMPRGRTMIHVARTTMPTGAPPTQS